MSEGWNLTLGHCCFFAAKGTVLVATTRLSASHLLRVSRAAPENIPCVTIATTEAAPLAFRVSAALTRVPPGGLLVEVGGLFGGEREDLQVSAMSSTRMQILSLTVPTRVIFDTSFGRARSLWLCLR